MNDIATIQNDLAVSELLTRDILVEYTDQELVPIFNDLTARTRNIIREITGIDSPGPRVLHRTFIERFPNLYDIPRAGIITVEEISGFMGRMTELLRKNADSDITSDDILLLKLWQSYGIDLREDAFFRSNLSKGRAPLVYLVDKFQRENVALTVLERKLFDYHFSATASEETNGGLTDLATEEGFTQERFRLRLYRVGGILRRRIAFIQQFASRQGYGSLMGHSGVAILDEKVAAEINATEGTSFPSRYIWFILSVALEGEAICFPSVPSPAPRKGVRVAFKKSTIKNFYLIRPNLFDSRLYMDFLFGFMAQLNKKMRTEFCIPLSELFHEKIPIRMKGTLRKIMDSEFNITWGPNHVILPPNSSRSVRDAIYDILKRKDRPMKMDEIFRTFRRDYSGKRMEKSTAIRSNVLLHKDVFISFGRTSTYGLREWETSHDNIRGGTIRKIVAEFLIKFEEPQHINDITVFVNKYRTTKARSVLTNLKLQVKKDFVFFKAGYVGLLSKHAKKRSGKS